MKINTILATAGIVTIMMTGAAYAENHAPEKAPAAAEKPDGKNFDERKAEVLKKMDERISKIQERKSCVSASKDKESLRACFPNRGEHKGPGMREGKEDKEGL